MKHQMHLFLFLALTLASCSTPEPKHETELSSGDNLNSPVVTFAELQDKLGVVLSSEDTGLREKNFDACDIEPAPGELMMPLKNCHHAYFVLIQFKLSCRENDQPDGALSDSDLTPLRNKNLQWKIDQAAGQIKSNEFGQGVIRFISPTSIKNSFLRISTGTDFLNMRAKQVTAIVTPPSWCSP